MAKIQADVRPYVSVFLNNVSVDGIDLSGMTWEEGSAAVWAQANAKQSGWYVRLKNSYGEYKDITAETLGITFNPSQALQEAWAIGHETSAADRRTVFELKEEIDAMNASSAAFYSVQASANTAPIDDILAILEKNAYKAPQDAAILSFNPDDSLNPFTFQDEVVGQKLDTESIKAQILQMVQTFQSGEVMLETTPLYPSVTKADLQKSVTLRCRAVTPIDKKSTDARNENIRVAFRKINGMHIADGGKFSFNGVVGDRTEKNGFHIAFEYNYGELVEGVGGGVCQASTTVYLAAIQSGLTITSRKAHSTPVSYTQLGQDATVSDTKGRKIDLTFKNETGGMIFLAAHVVQDTTTKNRLLCEVRIYGLSLENVRYALVTEPVETLPKPTEPEYVKDTKHKYTTFAGEEKEVIKASEGYVVETYLRTLVDGVETERKKVATDTYPNRPARIYVGVD